MRGVDVPLDLVAVGIRRVHALGEAPVRLGETGVRESQKETADESELPARNPTGEPGGVVDVAPQPSSMKATS